MQKSTQSRWKVLETSHIQGGKHGSNQNLSKNFTKDLEFCGIIS